MICFQKREGSITVFLTILFLLFFSLIGVAFENIRVLSSGGYVHVAAHSAAMTAFGDYNRELFKEYGLLAFGGFQGIGREELEREFLMILQKNLESTPTQSAKTYSNLYRIQELACETQEINTLIEEEVFLKQIESVLKSTAANKLLNQLPGEIMENSGAEDMQSRLAMTKDFEEGKFDKGEENQKDSKDAKKKETEKSQQEDALQTETSEKDTAGGNPLKMFSKLVRTGVLSLVCDTDTLSDGIVEPCELPEGGSGQQGNENREEAMNNDSRKNFSKSHGTEKSAADFLQGLLGDDGENFSVVRKGVKKAELIAYACQQFAFYGKESERTTKYGLEYLFAGKKEEEQNLSVVVNRLLTIRTLLNATYVFADAGLQNKSLATATAIAGFTGLPPVISAVQYTILLILAFQETCVDVTALLEGRQVPLTKNVSNFKMKYEEICVASKALFAKKANGYPKEKKTASAGAVSYQQYLCFFLFCCPAETIQRRSFDLIQYDLRERYNQSFCIQDCICRTNYKVSYEIPYVFDELPLLSVKDHWAAGKRSLEVPYEYKNK